MHIYDLIDKNLLDDMIAKKYINVQVHREYGYKIYNYSKICSLEHVWNNATELCRGLITDEDGNIIARPFRKFYNYEEITDKSIIPTNLPYKIYDKKDGSLGILYWSPDGNPMIATRGSFTSEQAKWATDYLRNRLIFPRGGSIIDHTGWLRTVVTDGACWCWSMIFNTKYIKYTLLFEIVYPEDRHVVDYGNEESLTLLAIINNETGEELEIETNPYGMFDVIKQYDAKDWKNIREMYDGSNAEGFVVKFENGFRMKLKYEEWFRKNALLYGLSKRKVLEFVMNNDLKSLFGIVNQLNEENKIYYQNVVLEIRGLYSKIECEAFSEYKEFETDKEAAEYFKTCKNTSILFSIRKGQDYSKIIWRKIKDIIKEVPNCE